MSGDPAAGLKNLALAGRQALRALWARRDERERLAPPELRLLGLLEQHRHYRAYWEGAEPTAEENPFLHITLHQILDQHLAAGEPPDTRLTLARLVAGGMDEHEAGHEVLRVLVKEIHKIIGEGKPFDLESYNNQLARLGRPAERERE